MSQGAGRVGGPAASNLGERDARLWTIENTSASVRNAQYAVRGTMSIRAGELQEELSARNLGGACDLPFESVVYCNIGNPQQFGQKPITFLREVCSLIEYPGLLDDEKSEKLAELFAPDAIARAQELVRSCGPLGAYTNSKGILGVRRNVAKFIEDRDTIDRVDPENIFLTNGASPGVNYILQCLIDSPETGIMIPVPQYPLYSATIAMYNGRVVPYYLREEDSWAFRPSDIVGAILKARKEGTKVRALCVINPGNPTGAVLRQETMRALIDIAYREKLVILADEVYQDNIHSGSVTWTSFRNELSRMSSAVQAGVQLVSFHSLSKGVYGECGRRGGYFECVNIPGPVMQELYKLASISLCPNVQGQIALDVMVSPPRPGDASYGLFVKEKQEIKDSLKRRAKKLCETFGTKMEGVTCCPANGALYLFPQIRLSEKAVAAARAKSLQPDLFYCLSLLEKTGICVVPGCGFLQVEGTFHFRIAFLPAESVIDAVAAKLVEFHESFMDEFRDTL